MNMAQEAYAVVSANRPVNLFGPTGFKAHHGTEVGGGGGIIPINCACYSEEHRGILSAHMQTPVELKALWL